MRLSEPQQILQSLQPATAVSVARERCRNGLCQRDDRNIATSLLVLWGLRGTAGEVNDSWKHSEFNIPEKRKDADHEPGDRVALDA